MANILITARSFEKNGQAAELLRSAGHQLCYAAQSLPQDELIAALSDKAALIAGLEQLSEAVILGAPGLKIIARYGVGYDRVDLAAAKRKGIPVTITPGANTIAVAELTFGLMLALARSIVQQDAALRCGSWAKVTGPELAGKTLGIIGLGAIGSEVAKRAHAFAMQLIAYDTCPREEYRKSLGVTYLPLSDVIANADFLSLHAPALPETIGLINRDSLKTMKPTAFLINTARGELVVEDDLIAALNNRVIAGAGLDAFACEPLQNSPLTTLSNVVLTPHAGSATPEAAARMSLTAAEEVVRVLSGQEPRYRVN